MCLKSKNRNKNIKGGGSPKLMRVSNCNNVISYLYLFKKKIKHCKSKSNKTWLKLIFTSGLEKFDSGLFVVSINNDTGFTSRFFCGPL